MLNFQEIYTTDNLYFEDFILVIFVFVDDLYQTTVPYFVQFRVNFDKALLSDS